MRVFLEVHLKLIATIWAILISVLALLLLMNTIKFSGLMSAVVSSKLEVVTASIERSVIKAEQLGLPLQEMNNLSDLLVREKHRDPQIRAIHVVDRHGNPLFSSESAALSVTPDSLLIRRALFSEEAAWRLDEEHALYTGLQLFDATGGLTGSIIIDYDKSRYAADILRVNDRLLMMTLAVFLVFAVFIFLAVRLGFGEVNAIFHLLHAQRDEHAPPQPDNMKTDSLSYQFARQMEQREKIKSGVEQELSQLVSPSSGAEHK
ncbi:hypothetical protein [Aliamphritea hakodatensis]|uniref:hypothetical protein n=1 Tax=Aliamphritea hakodatensis TaxID=2895352 RepID=UPI0022FD87A9|nr:hypothetical protein [Aliamphritea hakodatensis]